MQLAGRHVTAGPCRAASPADMLARCVQPPTSINDWRSCLRFQLANRSRASSAPLLYRIVDSAHRYAGLLVARVEAQLDFNHLGTGSDVKAPPSRLGTLACMID